MPSPNTIQDRRREQVGGRQCGGQYRGGDDEGDDAQPLGFHMQASVGNLIQRKARALSPEFKHALARESDLHWLSAGLAGIPQLVP